MKPILVTLLAMGTFFWLWFNSSLSVQPRWIQQGVAGVLLMVFGVIVWVAL